MPGKPYPLRLCNGVCLNANKGGGFEPTALLFRSPRYQWQQTVIRPSQTRGNIRGRRRLLNRFCCGTNDANELRRAPDGLAGRHARAWLSRRASAISRNQAYRKNRPGHGTRFDTGNNAGMKNIHKRGSRQSRLHWPRTPREGERHRYAYSIPYRSIFAFKLFSIPTPRAGKAFLKKQGAVWHAEGGRWVATWGTR